MLHSQKAKKDRTRIARKGLSGSIPDSRIALYGQIHIKNPCRNGLSPTLVVYFYKTVTVCFGSHSSSKMMNEVGSTPTCYFNNKKIP